MTRLDGPRLAPANGGAASALVVLLHGYGADGNDLIGLAEYWAPALPGVAFVAPNAPEPCVMSPAGRQWFSLTMRDPQEYWTGVNAAAPDLDAFIEGELARHRLTPDRLALVGFSQGTMLALHVGLRRVPAPAVIIGYSGLLAGLSDLPEAPAAPPQIVLVHGDRDDVLPIEHMFAAASGLNELGVPVEWHVSPGVGHGIDQNALAIGADVLARRLAPAR